MGQKGIYWSSGSVQGGGMRFFCCFILVFTLTHLMGESPRDEVRRLKNQLEQQQREFDRLTALLAEKEGQLRKLRVWMSNISTDGRFTSVSEREQRLLHALKILSDASGDMVLKTMSLAEQLRPRLNALPIASADRVRLVMALEDLERSAARVNSIADTAAAKEDSLLKDVRVTAIKYELNMAVLSVGALQGVFPGMTFVTADGKVKLRVLETRAMISGAVPVTGELRELMPGTKVQLEIIRKAPESVRK